MSFFNRKCKDCKTEIKIKIFDLCDEINELICEMEKSEKIDGDALYCIILRTSRIKDEVDKICL